MSGELQRPGPEEIVYRSDGTSFWFNRAGEPISVAEFERLAGDIEYKRIGGDTVVLDGKTLAVSTVWLGGNYRFDDGPPLIFETMVFGDHPLAEEACWRYSTEDEARAGHENVVRALRAARLTDEILADDPPKEITP